MIQDRIPHEKISEKLAAWSLPECDFDILDELKSDSDIDISKSTLVVGNASIGGTLTLKNKCFFIVCGTLSATNFLTGYGCTVYLNVFQVSNLFHVAQTDAVTFAFRDSSAKFVLSGHSMGHLSLDSAKLTAEIVDRDVWLMNGAELDFKSRDLIKDQFPNFISQDEWEGGDEDFWREKAHLLGLENIDDMDEEALFELGLEAISKSDDDFNVFDAADKIINGK